jgi:hypothetical protein
MEAGKLRVVTLLIHESGEWLQSDGIEISEIGEPQQFGAESTYFRRYDGCSFIGVAPDEDTDAQQAGNRSRRTTPAQAMQNSSIPPPDYEPDLPSEKISQQPASPQTKTTAQPPTSQPAAAQGASQSQGNAPEFTEPDKLMVTVKTVKLIDGLPAKPAIGDVPAMKAIRARADIEFLGQHNGVSRATCFKGHLFPLLKESVGLECVFQIAEKDSLGKHYINIEDVVYSGGVEYMDGKPLVKGTTK